MPSVVTFGTPPNNISKIPLLISSLPGAVEDVKLKVILKIINFGKGQIKS